MDQAIRNKLRSVVTHCRRLLEESIAQQLQGKYDIYATGKKDEVRAEKDVPLAHLTDEEREARQDILAHFEHVEALGYKPRESLEQLIREIAFTHLNRLCAYKMMEVRDVYVGGQRFREAVSKGLKSQGFLFYMAENPEVEKRYNAGHQEEAYRHFLNWLGGTLSQEIGVLFSPTDPANRVYPPQRVLDDVLDLINSEELKGIWSEDETIGWVYQYFTPKELRDEARKASQAPRNSYELAFRNQFFTPRYVVEFLTDNTLGRIWYEMRAGKTRLKDDCRYMVRRPGEVFFTEKESEPDSPVKAMRDMLLGGTEETFPPFLARETHRLVELAHTVDSYERHSFEDQVEGEWWPWAKLREIREAGDLSRFPAQDLLDVLFCQARADRHGGGGDWDEIFYDIANEVRRRAIEGRKEDASQEQLLRAITAVVHRAKKDPREIKILDPACGSGHFLLYGFALLLVIYEEAYDDPELGPGLQGEYPTKDDLRRAVPGLILRHNLHGIDIDLRCTQIAALALWLRCQRAYQEMGFKRDRPRITRSNIVCAEPMPGEGHMLKEFVSQIEPKLLGQLVEVVFDKMKLAGEAGSLLKIEEEIRDAVAESRRQWRIGPVATQMRLFGDPKPLVRQQQFDLSGITDAQFFEQAEAKVVDALRSYTEQAQNGQQLQRRLFADDAVRGFAFVDLCHKRFDVVLMNPPFGDTCDRIAGMLEREVPSAKTNTYIAFVIIGMGRLSQNGLLGAITDSSFIHQTRYEEFRNYLLKQPQIGLLALAALGWEVLDSYVETACYVISNRVSEKTLFMDLRSDGDIRPLRLRSTLEGFVGGALLNQSVLYSATLFSTLPKSVLAFWLPHQILTSYRTSSPLAPFLVNARCGLSSSDNFRFYKLRWEVSPSNISRDKRWSFLSNGGPQSPLLRQHAYVIDFENNGSVIRTRVKELFGSETRTVINQQYYFRAGFTYGKRTESFTAQFLPEGFVFSNEGQAIFPNDLKAPWEILAYLNTSILAWLLNSIAGQHKEAGYVGSVPSPPDAFIKNQQVGLLTKENHRLLSLGSQAIPESPNFVWPLVSEPATLIRQLKEYTVTLLSQNKLFATRFIEVDRLLEVAMGFSSGELRPWSHRVWDIASILYDATNGELDRVVAHDMTGYLVGSILGRWDIRFATGEKTRTELPDPFDPLPVCSPGMLQGADLLPLTNSPDDYPIKIDWNGILVDAPDHPDDIIRRVRDVLEVIWKDRADAIEKEACEILGVADLRDYFRKPGASGFWDDHIKRYSKSRRKAPIYWLLQSSKKNYALWIYYHRLDKDILFKALLNYVEPKIRREEALLSELRSQKTALGTDAKGAKKIDKEIDRQDSFLSELRDFEDKLRRAANLHLDPDLNDGVVLNIAPLRELVPWKEAKSYWDELMDGKYEWSSIGKQLREKGLVK
jgi:hypothetical protein